MALKVLAGFLIVSAVAIPGTIYIAKPELFKSGKKEEITQTKPSGDGGSTQNQKGESGTASAISPEKSQAGTGVGASSPGSPAGGGSNPS